MTTSSPSQATDPAVEQAPARSQSAALIGWGLAFAILFGLLALLAIGLRNAQSGPVGLGDKVPEFTLTTFDGQEIRLQDHLGKVIVINFWASWCKPCEQEAAELQDAWLAYQERGDVLFLGVDYVDTQPEALGYLEKFRITYPNGPDLGTRISQSFRIRGVPETYFIDREGRLAYSQIGPFTSLAQIKALVDPMLEP
jgi:cytochrome c biogenesis protein CcmG/thiol:disulfide interchange protein DsbE